MPEYQYKQQAKITQTRSLIFTITANTPEEADLVAETLSHKLVWKEDEAEYPGLFVSSDISYEDDKLIDPEAGKPSIEILCSGEVDDYNMPEVKVHSNEADAISPVVQAQVLFGYEAVQSYLYTHEIPTEEELQCNDGEIRTLSFESQAELRGYTRFLAENAVDDVTILEVLPDHNDQRTKILFGEEAVSFYENEGHLPSDEDMAAMGAELIEVELKTEREKEIYFQALEAGSGWQNYVEVKE